MAWSRLSLFSGDDGGFDTVDTVAGGTVAFLRIRDGPSSTSLGAALLAISGPGLEEERSLPSACGFSSTDNLLRFDGLSMLPAAIFGYLFKIDLSSKEEVKF